MKTRQILAAMLLASMVALTACGQQPADTQTTAEQVQQADEGETVDLGGLIDDSVPLAGAPAMSHCAHAGGLGQRREKDRLGGS